MRHVLTALFLLAGATLIWDPSSARARVLSVEVEERTVVLDGESTGPHGRYEMIRGTITFGFDPAHPRNARITDLDLGPRNASGLVVASAPFILMQPTVTEMRRGVALVEISNRGGLASLRYFNGATATLNPDDPDAFGDLLLLRQGLTLMWVGWQWDVRQEEGQLYLDVPRARQPDGSPVEGLVRSDWVVDDSAQVLGLGHRGHVAHRPVAFDHPDHVLTVRDGRYDDRRVLPRSEWQFARLDADSAVVADSTHVYRRAGFDPGKIYELVYRAKNPAIVGLGPAAIRDAVAYLKYDTRSIAPVDRVIGVGISQTGRFLRHFLYDGFNTTENGRMAFDGVLALTAGAGRGSFNHRFAQPSRDGHRFSAFFYPTDIFPFTSRTQFDPVQWRSDGLHAHLHDPSHAPKTMFVNTGYEYYGRAASLLHTTPDGTADVALPGTDRIYHVASAQHVPGALPEGAVPDSLTGASGFVEQNPIDTLPLYRALLVAMVNWIDHGTPPPPSRYPTVSAGDLAPVGEVDVPRPRGIRAPSVVHRAHRMDYGPRWASERVITRQPPRVGEAFGTRVPRVDSLGNETGGIRLPMVQAPLATYTPWRLRARAASNPDELADFFGGMIPLALTPEAAEEAGDPRPSVQALYPARDAYRARVREACDRLIEDGFLLSEDRQRIIDRALALWDWRHADE